MLSIILVYRCCFIYMIKSPTKITFLLYLAMILIIPFSSYDIKCFNLQLWLQMYTKAMVSNATISIYISKASAFNYDVKASS